MRDYGKILPRYWTGGSGAALRWNHLARLLGAYLFSCPTAHPLGIFYLPLVTVAHELGCSVDEVRAALRVLSRVGIASYDEAESLVWVPEMARVSIGETLSGGDKRRPWLVKELAAHRRHPFHRLFLARYASPYGLPQPVTESPIEGASEALGSPIEGASGSIEMEQEQEQDQDPPKPPTGGECAGDTPTAQKPADPPPLLDLGEPVRRARGDRRKPERPLPADWAPSEAHREQAIRLGVDVEREAERFRNHAAQNDRRCRDWDAAFRNWLLSAAERRPSTAAPMAPARQPLPEAHDPSAVAAKIDAFFARGAS